MSPFTAAFRRPWASELNCEYQIGAPAENSGDDVRQLGVQDVAALELRRCRRAA